LRHEVFVVGQGVAEAIERDGQDTSAVHAIAWTDDPGRPVGTGRLLGEPPGAAQIGRMAVRASARGRGVGVAVLRLLEREAMWRGHRAVALHAQEHARDFYARAGYAESGERFVEAGIAHLPMRKVLPVLRPVRDDDSAALIALIGACWSEYAGCVLHVDAEEPWLRAPARSFGGQGGRMWVAERDGTVLGCVGMAPAGGDAVELKSLYVAAAARRQGLGEVLAGLVENEARSGGARRLELWSDTRFTDAHRLYNRLGYTRLPASRVLHDLSDTTEYAFAKDLAAATR
ncbi:MAG TPA: GNAT family N-acetyltransferase, partial [Cryptosporangiaceae bacterium]|nr:GNAT family N-acetyltransferase [Cryptosporangiaceae bacterium]